MTALAQPAVFFPNVALVERRLSSLAQCEDFDQEEQHDWEAASNEFPMTGIGVAMNSNDHFMSNAFLHLV